MGKAGEQLFPLLHGLILYEYTANDDGKRNGLNLVALVQYNGHLGTEAASFFAFVSGA